MEWKPNLINTDPSLQAEKVEWEEVLAYAKLHYLIRDRDPSLWEEENGKYWLYGMIVQDIRKKRFD